MLSIHTILFFYYLQITKINYFTSLLDDNAFISEL